MLKHSRKKPSESEFYQAQKYTCYYYFLSLEELNTFLRIKKDSDDDNWFAFHCVDGKRTVLYEPPRVNKLSPLVKSEEIESSSITGVFSLNEMLKALARD